MPLLIGLLVFVLFLAIKVMMLEKRVEHLTNIAEEHNRTFESQTGSLKALGEITKSHTRCIEVLTEMEKAKMR